MEELTAEGLERIEQLARRHDISTEAAITLLRALVAGGGTMAQFNHPDLGGMGQWSQGGMIMVGDIFNNTLKAKVDGLCRALASLLADQSNGQQMASNETTAIFGQTSLFVPAGSASFASWWGEHLGAPSSTGCQNSNRYAYFPTSRRLAIETGGKVTLYDTGDHQIGGASQQQSADASLTFTSQHGLVRIRDLRLVLGGTAGEVPMGTDQPAPFDMPSQDESAGTRRQPAEQPPKAESAKAASLPPDLKDSGFAARSEKSPDIIMLIERLARLREKNILSEEEFSTKKTELLARL